MFGEIIGAISNFMYSYLLIIMLIGVGLYYTLRTRLVQVRMFKETIRVILEKPVESGAVSSFQALMVSTASRVGTGNIIGISTAICLGGYGAVFWMWVTAIIGSSTAFIEATLAQLHKEEDPLYGGYRGGPAYYIQQGLGQRWLGIIFAWALILCFAFGFNGLQAFNMTSALEYYIPDYATNGTAVGVGIVLIVFTAFVIFGGAKRISIITSIIVPIMAIAYILIALWTTIANIGELPAVFGTIFQSAFNFQSIAGGFAGSVVMLGIKRGLFSNEAGMGSAPNAAATASVSHPVKQGLVQSLSVYIDTLLICTCSAMMVMVFWVQDPETAMALNGMPLVQMAVNNAVGEVGIHFITFAIFAFAFSSLIGNYFYAETNFRYIFKNTKWGMLIFRVLCLAAIFYGCVNSFDLAWNLADIFMGFMAIINLVAILLLGKWALAALDDYTRQRKEGKDPVFIAASVPGMPACECWTTADLPNFGDNPVEEYIEEAASLDSEGLR